MKIETNKQLIIETLKTLQEGYLSKHAQMADPENIVGVNLLITINEMTKLIHSLQQKLAGQMEARKHK